MTLQLASFELLSAFRLDAVILRAHLLVSLLLNLI